MSRKILTSEYSRVRKVLSLGIKCEEIYHLFKKTATGRLFDSEIQLKGAYNIDQQQLIENGIVS